ncbi:sigma factor G inhibitor Gin [Clostridium polynesiense]|uniref:sigma factor G inhibitor Gin n=1 Tax=Clostridium polynesiense TaxID=1325933 RepID=UPI00058C6ADE|nr:sigma factor G inhibitor Gin [Clostridium polynesiense]
MVKKSCIICRKSGNDGIIINGKRICRSCEKKMISSEAGNDFYEYYKECLKKDICQFTVKFSNANCEVYN